MATRIGIELGQIIPRTCGGIVPLLQGTLQTLFANHPDFQYELLCTEANAGLFPTVPGHVHRRVLPGAHYFQRMDRLAEEIQIDVLFRSYPLDVPLAFPTQKQVMLVPDMQHEYFPAFFDKQTLQTRRISFNKALAESGAIATLSNYAKQTILDHPGTRCRDVFLMTPALMECDLGSLTHEELSALPSGDYFLFPGNLWPHKNHRRTLDAFRLFLKVAARPFQLILTGHPEGWEALAAEFPGLPVLHLGFVRRPMLQALMQRATALVFFSLFEGFGIPLLEAFAAGTPVVCSNTTSLPEVGGDAILSCDPTDVHAMAAALRQVVVDRNLRDQLAEAGTRRLQLYHWGQSADNLHAACTRVASRGRIVRHAAVFHRPPLSRSARFVRALLHPRKVLLPALQREAKRVLPGPNRIARALSHPRRILLPALAKRMDSLLGGALTPHLGTHQQYPPRPLVLSRSRTRSLPFPAQVVSIVTPSFNQAAFLERTIRSVLDQGYPALEYIVQDGGSSDATPVVLEQFRARLTRCESSPDSGQANAINIGFNQTTGELMAYLNSDDLLLPGALAYVSWYFHRNPDVDVIYGHRIIINEHDQEVGRWILPPHDDEVLLWNDYVPQETLFWRRRVWASVGGAVDEDFQFALDWDLLLRFRATGARMVRVPRFLGAFRVHAQQKTCSQMGKLGYPEIELLRQRNLGRSVTEEEVRAFVRPYLRRHVWYQLLHQAGVLL